MIKLRRETTFKINKFKSLKQQIDNFKVFSFQYKWRKFKVKETSRQFNLVPQLEQCRISNWQLLFYLICQRLVLFCTIGTLCTLKSHKNICKNFFLFISALTSLSCSLCSVLADHDTVDEMHFHERSAHTGHQLSTVQSNIYLTALYCIDLLSPIG